MMRPIEFRGLDKRNKKHVCGAYVPPPLGTDEHYIFNGDVMIPVFPNSVGQFTGEQLNKKINEWDVLLWESNDKTENLSSLGLVVFDKGSFKVMDDSGRPENLSEWSNYNSTYEKVTVVGTLLDFQETFPNYHYLAE